MKTILRTGWEAFASALGVSLGILACSASTTPAARHAEATSNPSGTPTTDGEYQGTLPPEQRAKPPESAAAPEWRFPTIHHTELANGLRLHVIQRTTLPIVEMRLVVLSGQSTDGDKPGTAVVAGELLKAGGTGQLTSQQMLDKIESLGSSLSVLTDRDTTRLSLAVTRDHFDEALSLVADVARKPSFAPGEFKKLQRREMDQAQSSARANAGWGASMVLYKELFQLPTARHPYATYDATAAQIQKLGLWDCQSWHRTHFTPKNAFLVITGDVTPEQAKAATEKVFGSWKGAAPAKPSFNAPAAPNALRIFVVDRPDSPQAEVRLAVLGPERTSPDWATTNVANQILGGGVAGRLFLDVREKRSLAYSTYSGLVSVAHGPSPIVLSAGTQTAKAPQSLAALLEHLSKISSSAPAADETAIATRYLADVFVLKMETAGALADLTVGLSVHGLSDDYYDKYRDQVRQATAETALAAAKKYYTPERVVAVVAGDAKVLGTPLSHFGEVIVVDPEKGFAEVKRLPKDPAAKIELERRDGT